MFGVPEEVIDQVYGGPKEPPYEVWKENVPAVEMFCMLATQWTWAGLGERVGLNYSSLDFLLKIYPSKRRRQLFEDLRTMELSALQAFREDKK